MLSDSERDRAIKEGHRNEAEIAYFQPRSFYRISNQEEAFNAGFDRGWDAATSPLLARIAEFEANEKVLLAQVQGHTKWREKIIKASEQAYGESAIRYKFSLTKNGKCMNTFPKEIDGRWFALVPAEDDGHIGHIARIAELTRELEEARKDAERYRKIITVCESDGFGYWLPEIFLKEGQLPPSKADADAAIDEAIKEQT